MADTQRSLPTLILAFAQNVTQAIRSQNFRDLVVSIFGGYGGMYATGGGASTVNIAAAKYTGWTTSMPASGTTPDPTTNEQVRVDVDGDFSIDVQMSLSTSVGARTVTAQVYVNGIALPGSKTKSKQTTANDMESVTIHTIATLIMNDVVTVYLSADVDGTSVTVAEAQLRLKRVG